MDPKNPMETNAAPAAPGARSQMSVLRDWAFAQFPIAIAVYDQDNRLVRANDEMLRITGFIEDEIRGRRFSDFQLGSPFDEFTRLMDQVKRTGEPIRVDNSIVVPGDGRERVWASFFTPLKDDSGRAQGVSIAALDVTEEYRAQQRLALVNDAGARIGTTLDVNRTAAELTEATVGRFADFACVDLLETALQGEPPQPGATGAAVTLRRAAQLSVTGDGSETAISPGDTHFYPPLSPPARALTADEAALYRTGDPDVLQWAASTPALPPSVRDHGVHSVIVVPLNARDTPIGLVLFVRHGTTESFDDHDLLLAEEIAARAAICIDNARRYARERKVALTLQRSLLPGRLPHQAAVEVTTRYLPASSQAGVGGDWYDVIPLSGARVALVVGDVVGHGLQASATMGRLRAAVRTLADIDLPPDELLTHLDDLVIQLTQDRAAEAGDDPAGAREMGASCLYAVYDPVSRRCVLARAGHPAPVLVTSDGTAAFLELPSGPPLGLGGLPFESYELELPEGSLLALYTDGLVEGHGQDINEGLEKLRECLARPADSLDQTCDDVLGTLLHGRPADDIALLLARTRALHPWQVASWELSDDPATVADARRGVVGRLEDWGLEELSFTTELVVSELVTNAIRHAEPPIRLRLIRDSSLICEVSDGSSTSPRMRRARAFDEGGRGLLLVAQLSRRWGTRFTADGGKTIWAEQPLTPAD